MKIIEKYFNNLSHTKLSQFAKLEEVYKYWNNKINIISRKDFSNFYRNHVLHSLSIAKLIQFKKGTKIIDVGTGGGFPGVPLAIMFPDVEFTLVDSIGKKIKVVDNVCKEVKINNVKTINERIENLNGKYDFIVSRAVTNMQKFTDLVDGKINDNNYNKFDNGILYLKGGDLSSELDGYKYSEFLISNFFEEEYFKTKKIVYI